MHCRIPWSCLRMWSCLCSMFSEHRRFSSFTKHPFVHSQLFQASEFDLYQPLDCLTLVTEDWLCLTLQWTISIWYDFNWIQEGVSLSCSTTTSHKCTKWTFVDWRQPLPYLPSSHPYDSNTHTHTCRLFWRFHQNYNTVKPSMKVHLKVMKYVVGGGGGGSYEGSHSWRDPLYNVNISTQKRQKEYCETERLSFWLTNSTVYCFLFCRLHEDVDLILHPQNTLKVCTLHKNTDFFKICHSALDLLENTYF